MRHVPDNLARLILLAVLLAPMPAAGQSAPSQPASQPTSQPASRPAGVEDAPIGGRGAGPSWQAAEGTARTVLALAIVAGLIVLARVLLRRGWRGQARNQAAGALEIVARIPAGPRQQLLLIRLGDRLVLAGQSAGGFERLGEVVEGEQVERIVSALAGGSAPKPVEDKP
jgi:flagellar biogenesis protein FliO